MKFGRKVIPMNNLFTELKRRNIFRVAGVYAVVGWILMQVAALLENSLNLPPWFDTVITAALLIGFPIAVLLAWAFEMTPEGVKRTESVEDGDSITGQTGRRLDFAILGGLVVVIGLVGWQISRPEPLITDSPVFDEQAPEPLHLAQSIAVLPFVNMSPDKDQEYFADGISEEILNALVKVTKLRVAGRTSSFSFKNSDNNIKEIGEILNVSHILEGSVRKQGNQVRITAQLIKADDGFHLWSDTYDGSLDNIFDLQEDISRKVTSNLKILLELETGERLASKMTSSVDAYDLFLRGRQLVAKRFGSSIPDGIALLEQAVELDPKFAEAWAALAEAEAVSPDYIPIDYNASIMRAKAHIKTAIALNENLALPYAVAGLLMDDEGDYLGQLAALQKALALEPNNALTIRWLGSSYMILGRFDKALPLIERAYSLDPLSSTNSYNMGTVNFSLGNLEEAKRYFNIHSNLGGRVSRLGLFILDEQGDHAGAIELFMRKFDQDVLRLGADQLFSREQAKIYALGAFGGTEQQRRAARDLPDNYIKGPGDAGAWQLKDHLIIGNTDRVFEILSAKPEFFNQFSGDQVWIQHKAFKAFRADPRFVNLLEQHNFPDAWQEIGWPEFCKPNPGTDGSRGQFTCH